MQKHSKGTIRAMYFTFQNVFGKRSKTLESINSRAKIYKIVEIKKNTTFLPVYVFTPEGDAKAF
jgi:hypothetical protein